MNPKKPTSWGKVADWYDAVVESEGSYQKELILPNLLRLVGSVEGKKLLDLACGQGFFSHALARAGAKVTGVDVSPELIDIGKSGRSGAEFIVGSAEKLPAALSKFDIAFCVLALQNIKDLNAAVGEVSRVLQPRGTFHIVLNHPAFRIPGKSSWGFDEAAAVQFRRLDGYLSDSSSKILMHPGKQGGAVTYSFHRPLQQYFKAFAKHGFAVARLEEWISNKESQHGPRKKAEDRARKEFPLFLYLELIKS